MNLETSCPGHRTSQPLGLALASAALLLFAASAHAGNLSQAFVPVDKLVGTGAVGAASQGGGIALSSDGGTALVGGYNDASGSGAVWVFTRGPGGWTQQGSKLVGTGAVGAANQGSSVAVSGDGNTALIGGFGDDSSTGAVWVFTRSGGGWTQQGGKLVGTGAVGAANQGDLVALSADGNTALFSGPADSSIAGAAWVFTRSGGVWAQQGSKLVATGAVGIPHLDAVALSADGNTALVGGTFDNGGTGAGFVFTRSGSTWTQQDKLVGTGKAGIPHQGRSVALSGDGSTAILGGDGDGSNAGAAWVFTRSGGTWTQQGNKLAGTGFVGTQVGQGGAVALSGDGNAALVGGSFDGEGPSDSNTSGAMWVWKRSGGSWTQQGIKLVGPSPILGMSLQGTSVALSADARVAMSGGLGDDSGNGAAWIFKTSCVSADANGDGTVSVLDVFYTINFLFAGGPAPVGCP